MSRYSPRNPFSTSFALVLWTEETYLGPYQNVIKPYGYSTFLHQVNFFLFLYSFYILLVHATICIYFLLLVAICVFFLLNTIGLYIMHMKCLIFLHVKMFFFLLFSVLVYHGYTHAYIDSWWVGTQLNIFQAYQ